MTKRKAITSALVALMMLTASVASAKQPAESRADDVKQLYRTTAKYHNVANLGPEFGPFSLDGSVTPTCFDDSAMGGMGIHYVRNVGDGVIDPANPEAMVYEIDENGKQRLVAVEYVAVKALWPDGPPELFGQTFTEKYFPEIDLTVYKLHVWLWKWNPSGLFADHNPRVNACP